MKATVYVKDGEPAVADFTEIVNDLQTLNIAPEYALKLSIWALQHIHANSRCHNSRVTARTTLQMLADTGEVSVGEQGLPSSVKFPGNPVDEPNVWVR